MVVLMDGSASWNGEVKSNSVDRSCKDECGKIDRSSLDIPSSIPSSCIYRYNDFICSKIADGFYGDVYKVQHRETGEFMVLKMNKPDVEKDDCTMLDEIKLMSHLSHENVIRFLGICVDDNRVHLLCENCLIKERKGWRYAIVADLGLATDIKEQSIVGSPYNMAPELLRGEPYDDKADVFSYGIILCEIIGRVQADPDELPRTHSFGLDVEKFQLMTGDCPYEFLQTALWCCQMCPRSRPKFAVTAKHLEFILEGYTKRPELNKAIETSPSTEEIKYENETAAVADHEISPESSPPAIIVSTDEISPVAIRSNERRRQSWIAGRYKLFNTGTDDLLKNTPGKLKSFFHRVLRLQTHYDPSKQKKSKENSKSRSASQLKSFSVMNSDDENVPNLEQASSPNTDARRCLRLGSSEQDKSCELGYQEDSLDGVFSPLSPCSESAIFVTSPSSRPLSPKMPEAPQSPPNLQNPAECDTTLSKLYVKPRSESTPLFHESRSEPISRHSASHRDCQVSNVDQTSFVTQAVLVKSSISKGRTIVTLKMP
ncbi:Dual specificity testis-specific protein kinase 2 [Stylophora pistillata]|uniref:Dual specificity testis-specific protein kinase 2 n=1 Tax=Stylophora pistillata TaxID=50429 RepID=A0A2B4RYC9_STYPI|nr:Dual specificity testis-specific protein kinase 2 [Stylophora pistillata]